MKKVMFICSGNTCRSPLAEGLFKKYIADKGITDIEVDSAGVAVFSGDDVSVNSALVAIKHGVDISLHRAKQLNPQHISETDLFVCMSDSHEKIVGRYVDKSHILTLNVDDPYGKSVENYEKCALQIEKSFPEILSVLQKIPVCRKMAENDIFEIAELERECFSKPWSENALREELDNETSRFFVLRNDKGVVGYIGANNICGEVYITNVAVTKSERGKGYGKLLVNHLINQSDFENANFVTLEVRKSNTPAIKLYELCGFKQVGERRNFYSKPQEDALLYTYYLKG